MKKEYPPIQVLFENIEKPFKQLRALVAQTDNGVSAESAKRINEFLDEIAANLFSQKQSKQANLQKYFDDKVTIARGEIEGCLEFLYGEEKRYDPYDRGLLVASVETWTSMLHQITGEKYKVRADLVNDARDPIKPS